MKLAIKKHNGFTFVELVIYIGLLSIVVGGAILFAWDIIYAHAKSQTQWEVNQNLRLAAKRILFEIRNASNINSINTTSISLANSDLSRNPTVISFNTSRISIDYGPTSPACPAASPCPLTSNQITVSNLSFTDLSFGNSKNIFFTITISATGTRKEYQLSQTYEGTAELRSF